MSMCTNECRRCAKGGPLYEKFSIPSEIPNTDNQCSEVITIDYPFAPVIISSHYYITNIASISPTDGYGDAIIVILSGHENGAVKEKVIRFATPTAYLFYVDLGYGYISVPVGTKCLHFQRLGDYYFTVKPRLPIEHFYKLGAGIVGTQKGELCGTTVAISNYGDTIAVGSPNYDGGRGRIRLFQYFDTTGFQSVQDLIGEETTDHYGEKMVLDSFGTIIAVGTPDYDYGRGRVKAFIISNKHNFSKFLQRGQDLFGTRPGERFGEGLAFGDSYIAVGSPGYRRGRGRVQVFQYSSITNLWTRRYNQMIGPTHNENFGAVLAMNSDNILIGSPNYNFGTGIVRVYVAFNGETLITYGIRTALGFPWKWIQRGDSFVGSEVGDHFGSAVAISENALVVAIGSSESHHQRGSVRVYRWQTVGDINTWVHEKTYIGQCPQERFGSRVVLAKDGEILGISAPNQKLGRGCVYFYNYNPDDKEWTPYGSPLQGTEEGGMYGSTLALSSKANTLGISSVNHNDVGWVELFTNPYGEEFDLTQ